MSFRTVYSEPEHDMQGSSKSDSEPDDDALTLKWSVNSSSNSTSVVRFPGRKFMLVTQAIHSRISNCFYERVSCNYCQKK